MENTPIARELIDKTIEDFHITDFAKATIREVRAIAAKSRSGLRCGIYKNGNGSSRTTTLLRRCKGRN